MNDLFAPPSYKEVSERNRDRRRNCRHIFTLYSRAFVHGDREILFNHVRCIKCKCRDVELINVIDKPETCEYAQIKHIIIGRLKRAYPYLADSYGPF